MMFSFLSGNELLSTNEHASSYSILDYWKWAYSDLHSNVSRGVFAEFLVGSALDIVSTPREEWAPYDLIYDKYRIEVKSASYLQSWDENFHEHILFDISPKKSWSSDLGYSVSAARHSEIYVFCLFNALSKDIPVYDLSHWEFFILPTKTLDCKLPEQKKLSLPSLKNLDPICCDYLGLHDVISKLTGGSHEIT